MRKVTVLIAALAALAAFVVAAPATAATKTIVINASGFSPTEAVVGPGDTVTWQNSDTKSHQIVSDTGLFRSKALKTGEKFSYRFDDASSYSYHDGLKLSTMGVVHVVSDNVTIGISRLRSMYRNPVRVFGSIPTGQAGQQVTIHITPYRGQATTQTVTTDDSGTYEISYNPTIRTAFSATWNGTTSEKTPFVWVRPLVVFRQLNHKSLFFVRVKAARSYAHKVVRIQRMNSHGAWVTTTRIKLNRFSQRSFTAKFPLGTTRARAWVTRSPGYVVGFSTTKLITR
jgi:plastocyanin